MNNRNWWNTFSLVFSMSFKSFWIKKSVWLGMFIFAFCLLILFPFSLGTSVIKRPDVQLGCFWAIMEFVAALCIGRMFVAEQEGNALDILLSSRSQRNAIIFGKIFFTTFLIFSLFIPILFFWIVVFNVSTECFVTLIQTYVFSGLLFSFGSASLGATIYTLTSQSLAKEILQPILFFPLQTGVLLGCVSVNLAASSINSITGVLNSQAWWTLLICYPILFSACGWIFSFNLLEE